VLTTVVGVTVTTFTTRALQGEDEAPADTQTTSQPAPLPFPPSRLISSEQIGHYKFEADGSLDGATVALGSPTQTRATGDTCTVTWKAEGVEMEFYTLGGEDPCIYGRFCFASIYGGEWATTKGLQRAESVRRMWELYPNAKEVKERGATTRWVLERGTALCGREAKGGLEAVTAGGKVVAFWVSFLAGGD
jgi:hypothetical protein